MNTATGTSNDSSRILWCLVEGQFNPIPVTVSAGETISQLRKAIYSEYDKGLFRDINVASLDLLKVDVDLEQYDTAALLNLGALENVDVLSTWRFVSHYWPEQPADARVHVFVKHIAESRIRLRSPVSEASNDGVKRAKIVRKWGIHGPIEGTDTKRLYYLDPVTQEASKMLLTSVADREFILFMGARASGKSTRMLWLRDQIKAKGFTPLYVTFEAGITYDKGSREFWRSFGLIIDNAAALYRLPSHQAGVMETSLDFLKYFHQDLWRAKQIVLLIDEFGVLNDAPEDIVTECLGALRTLKHDRPTYAIRSLIAAGTYSILDFSTSRSVSPFNVAKVVQNPYFTPEDVQNLFDEFSENIGFEIDDDIAGDVWAQSNGHPAMVCLCGQTIENNLTLLRNGDRSVLFSRWQQFPAKKLYKEISSYDTFRSLIESLSRPQALDAIVLYRSRFAGFLDEIQLLRTEEKAANFLTSQGVLLKPDSTEARYQVASPLLDGFIRRRIIPSVFSSSPTSLPPRYEATNRLQVLDALVESLRSFDKELIFNASTTSYKVSKVKIGGSSRVCVPRESVYDTELMRILTNWLHDHYGWVVTGQWHPHASDGHKYSDIIIQDQDTKIVFELLATGDPHFVRDHITRTARYKVLHSADEAWVVHFTCEDNYCPIWQSGADLSTSLNVVHFSHNPKFTELRMSARWKSPGGIEESCDNRVVFL